MPRKNEPRERRCAVSREVMPVERLIRFVAAPDGTVVADLKRTLPGRGMWLEGRRSTIETAVRKRVFSRALKTETVVPEDLAGHLDAQLEAAALSALGLARKAGLVITGQTAVAAAVRTKPVVALIIACDAARDSAKRMIGLLRARYPGADASRVIRDYGSMQLDLALGRTNVIHAALVDGAASAGFLRRDETLTTYRSVGDAPASAIARNDEPAHNGLLAEYEAE